MSKKDNGSGIGKTLPILCYIAVGVYLGLKFESLEVSFNEKMLFTWCIIIISILLQVVIHELGHLIFGLISGYKFNSFRIFGFMWVKIDGKIRFKRLSVAGTAGQCLMIPPEMKDGKFPFKLHNLGGVILNILTGVIALATVYIVKPAPLVDISISMFGMFGLCLAFMNGVPMRLGAINNDGHNALSLGKHPAALKALWVQLKVMELEYNGARLKDMPQEWFYISDSDTEIGDALIATIGVFACQRLVDEQRFFEAERYTEYLLNANSGMVEIHRVCLLNELLYIEIIGQRRPERIAEIMRSPLFKKYKRAMKNTLAFIRTEYASALLMENDKLKAEKLRKHFDKKAKNDPGKGGIESDTALMNIADQIYIQ